MGDRDAVSEGAEGPQRNRAARDMRTGTSPDDGAADRVALLGGLGDLHVHELPEVFVVGVLIELADGVGEAIDEFGLLVGVEVVVGNGELEGRHGPNEGVTENVMHLRT